MYLEVYKLKLVHAMLKLKLKTLYKCLKLFKTSLPKLGQTAAYGAMKT